MQVLFLDDDPARHESFRAALNGANVLVKYVTTAEEAIAALRNLKFDLVCLDHDLNGQKFVESGPGTGFEVAERLIETENKDAQVVVHTLNEEGARKMLEVLGPKAVWVPFYQIRVIVNAIRIRTRAR